MANSTRDESSKRAALACFFASDMQGARSVRYLPSLSLGTITKPTSIRPSRKAAFKWIMSMTSRSLLADTCTSTPMQTLVPFTILHLIQSISPETFLVQPPRRSNCLSISFLTAAPPLESFFSATRS
jgi:hypothetical protein